MARRKKVPTAVKPDGATAKAYGLKSAVLTKRLTERFVDFVTREQLVPRSIELAKESLELFYCIYEELVPAPIRLYLIKLQRENYTLSIKDVCSISIRTKSLELGKDLKTFKTLNNTFESVHIGISDDGLYRWDYWTQDQLLDVFCDPEEPMSVWSINRSYIGNIPMPIHHGSIDIDSLSKPLQKRVVEVQKKQAILEGTWDQLRANLLELCYSCATIWDLFYLMPEAEPLFSKMMRIEEPEIVCSDTPAADNAANVRKLLNSDR